MAARASAALAESITTADLVIPDGAGVVWALSRQRIRVIKTAGIELAWSMLDYASMHGWRVALVGASPAVMATLRQTLPGQLPGLNLVLAEDGYQSPERQLEIENRLASLKPDLVLIALGVPRQELWSQRVHQDLPGLWMGVGGSFDVWAGITKRAPAWMCRLQLEWLYRLIQEPSRWRRMLSLPAFAWSVIRQG